MLNKLRVTNKHHGRWPHRRYVYIGRPSVLGNPFPIGSGVTREEVVSKYRDWLYSKLEEGNPAVIAELDRIVDLLNDGSDQDVCLECFCAPQACHGDIIKEVIEQVLKGDS